MSQRCPIIQDSPEETTIRGITNYQSLDLPHGTFVLKMSILCPFCQKPGIIDQLVYEERDHTGLPGQRRIIIHHSGPNSDYNHNVDLFEVRL